VIDIPLPKDEARLAILNIHMKGMPITKGVQVDNIVSSTDGLSGAELKALVVEAGMCAIREDKNKATKADFSSALETIQKKRADNQRGPPNSLWS
jgi:ATP-dependent 26S proteasome regulatory subunit